MCWSVWKKFIEFRPEGIWKWTCFTLLQAIEDEEKEVVSSKGMKFGCTNEEIEKVLHFLFLSLSPSISVSRSHLNLNCVFLLAGISTMCVGRNKNKYSTLRHTYVYGITFASFFPLSFLFFLKFFFQFFFFFFFVVH